MTADPFHASSSRFKDVAPATLRDRRRQLRRQRTWKSLSGSFRFLAVTALAGSVFWLVSRPTWTIRQADDILIKQNQWLSDEVLRSLVPLNYPTSLLHVDPQQIAETLEAGAPISDAVVHRQLIPPRLEIRVRERNPVAVAYLSEVPLGQANAKDRVGLLDAEGLWTPLTDYNILEQVELPQLRVLGTSDRYGERWAQVYAALKNSPVRVTEIDWRDPANVILTTEQLGSVRVGALGDRFPEQLQALDQLRHLPDKVDLNDVAYIDLRDPDSPHLQMRATSTTSPR